MHADHRPDHPISRKWFGDAFAMLQIGDVERGINHAQSIEQTISENMIKRVARDDFDHATENVSGVSVIPQRSRLLGQRQLGNTCGP